MSVDACRSSRVNVHCLLFVETSPPFPCRAGLVSAAPSENPPRGSGISSHSCTNSNWRPCHRGDQYGTWARVRSSEPTRALTNESAMWRMPRMCAILTEWRQLLNFSFIERSCLTIRTYCKKKLINIIMDGSYINACCLNFVLLFLLLDENCLVQ